MIMSGVVGLLAEIIVLGGCIAAGMSCRVNFFRVLIWYGSYYYLLPLSYLGVSTRGGEGCCLPFSNLRASY